MGGVMGKPSEFVASGMYAAPLEDETAEKPPVASTGDDILHFMAKVAIFQRLPREELPALAKAAQPVSFAAGEMVIKQGDEGFEFFLIKNGTANVDVDGRLIATLRGGDYFGEYALFHNEPRMATITAAENIECYTISRADFLGSGLIEKVAFPNRGAVGGGKGDVEIKPPCLKTPEERALICSALKDNSNLTTVIQLDDAKVAAVVDLMWKEEVPLGTEIIKRGDMASDYFYVVDSGQFEVLKANEQQSVAQAVQTRARFVGSGGSFGELALLYAAPRAATLVARSKATVWIIDRKQFRDVLHKSIGVEMLFYVEYLDKCGIFSSLRDDEKRAAAEALTEMLFSRGETVFQQGETGDVVYILVEGEVAVVKNGEKTARIVGHKGSVVIFGELALTSGEPRAASITVLSTRAKMLTLDKATFEMLIGPLADVIERGRDGMAVVRKVSAAEAFGGSGRGGHIFRKDLNKIGFLGSGAYGRVDLVEHVPTGKTYALKQMSKGFIVQSRLQESVLSEKTVQHMCDSPFVIKLFESYNGTANLYLLLEVALGGNLYETYNKKQLWGKNPCATFYVAGMTLAFEYLHGKKIVFRDLKPENVLLTEEGRVKLADMGLAKVLKGRTYTVCGTPDYFAPEVLKGRGHSFAVDWWGLGVMTYELMVGHTPFEAADPYDVYAKVLQGMRVVPFSPMLKLLGVQDFVTALCTESPSERLPMKKGGADNVKTHAWLKNFDWGAMFGMTLAPPYVPVVTSQTDASNCGACVDLPPQRPYRDPMTGWDEDFATCS